jgi:hypothetical protein
MVEKATVDCCNELEHVSGLFTMLEENLAVPFKTTVLGVPVTVDRVELNQRDQVVAICSRGNRRRRSSMSPRPWSVAGSTGRGRAIVRRSIGCTR